MSEEFDLSALLPVQDLALPAKAQEALGDLITQVIDSINEIFVVGSNQERIALISKLAPFLFQRSEQQDNADELLLEARRLVVEQWKFDEDQALNIAANPNG